VGERFSAFKCPVVVCGDFNVHVDQSDDVHAVQLAQILQLFGLVQHVSEPTHNAGHTLDLVIAKSETEVLDLRVGDMISDHALIRFTLRAKKPIAEAHWTTSRAWRRLSRDAFASDLSASRLCSDLVSLDNSASTDDLVKLYRDVMTNLLNKHCPMVKVRRKVKPMTPWFDADCRAARRCARSAERRFRRKRTAANKCNWAEKLKVMRGLYEDKNNNYWRAQISASKGDSKRLWRTLDGVLGKVESDDTGALTADDFATYFNDKVELVRQSTASTPLYDVPHKVTPVLDQWTVVTVDEVEKLIGSALNKTCQLDPAPTWLVKDMRGLLSPFFALLFNRSLASGVFPTEFKEAIVRPLLKKAGLDAADMKNFRPVSNLSFLSKLLERIVQKQMQAFLDSNGLMPVLQSAYRPFHSTETAVTKVYNDLLLAADEGQISALCLLDLTAAFDTVDHDLLMLRLERQFGLRGAVLQWFHDYLSGRSYQVVYGNRTSATVYITCSVPQGSVLGPRLFIMYSADLADIVSAHGVSYHAFADDTQMYLHCQCNDTASAINRLEHCGTDIGRWMSANRLKLNTSKSELLWAGSRYNISSLRRSDLDLQLGADTISPSDQVRVLGVTLSSDLSLEKHVSNVSAACFYRLRQLRRVRRSLDAASAATLVHAFVTSRIDYCNAVLAGTPKVTTDKLQRVMNAAARVVSDTRKFDRGLSQLLHEELHWLDVPQRIEYKLSVMVHRCRYGSAPQYLKECCTSVADVAGRQHLRSARRQLMVVPRYRRRTFGRRAFSVTGPTVWNSLSNTLREKSDEDSFKRQLKTFLFSRIGLAYPAH